MDNPVEYIDLQRFSACFHDSIGEAGCRRLMETPRLSERLRRIIVTSYNLGEIEEDLSTEDALLFEASSERLQDVILRSGALFWSNALANLVLPVELSSILEHLGDDIWLYALENRDLAGPRRVEDITGNALADIKRDGLQCLSAWCNTQPSSIARRVRLKLPPDDQLDAPSDPMFAEAGPVIVRRVVTARHAA